MKTDDDTIYKVFKIGSLGMKCGLTRKLMEDLDYDIKSIQMDKENPIDSLLKSIGYDFIQMKAVVDHRERAGMYQLMEELGFEVRALDIGDATTTSTAFERKSGDWFSSIFDRKLFKQLHEIKENFPNAFLVVDRPVEDLFREAAKRNISENAVIGGIASCAARGFPPMFLDNKIWCSKIMSSITLKAKDNRDRHDEYDPMRHAPSSQDINLNVLMRFPRMGWKCANQIMKHASNLEEAFKVIKSVESMSKEKLKETGLSRHRAICINTANLIRGDISEEE
jgi:ERCC4-type nuclease